MRRFVRMLEIERKLLAHLFARAKTGILDLDVFTDTQTSKSNQTLRHFADRHLLTHVEHIDHVAITECPGLDDQAGRCWDRHKEAHHVGMSDSDRRTR